MDAKSNLRSPHPGAELYLGCGMPGLIPLSPCLTLGPGRQRHPKSDGIFYVPIPHDAGDKDTGKGHAKIVGYIYLKAHLGVSDSLLQ